MILNRSLEFAKQYFSDVMKMIGNGGSQLCVFFRYSLIVLIFFLIFVARVTNLTSSLAEKRIASLMLFCGALFLVLMSAEHIH